jgi:hypothetical protein
MGQYLERYRAGECQQVWAGLLAQGAAIREEPLASDAWAVAQETMRRVRHNIELLIPRLRALGYRFGDIPGVRPDTTVRYWPEEFVFSPPLADTARVLDELEQRVGLLPLSLRAFFLAVGGVNLVGTHPTLDPVQLSYDPLFMCSLTELDEIPLDEEYDREDLEELRQNGEEGTVKLRLSPDVLHKYATSGGESYFMLVPNASIDGVFHDGFHEVPFVKYLRLCLGSGGLMDLEKSKQVKGVAEALAYLRQDLLPI